MNKLYSYLMRKMPLMISCEQADNFIDDYLAGDLSGRQRKIFQWHINLCTECRQYLEEYRQSIVLGKSHFHDQDEEDKSEMPKGIVQAILAAHYEGSDVNFDVFRSSPPFRGLTLTNLQQIYSNGEIFELDEGAFVIEEGKANSRLYVVLSGELKVSLTHSSERYSEVELANWRPPDCVGEYTLIDHKLASASVKATRKSELFKIQFDLLDEFMESDPELGRAIYRNILLLVVDRLRANDAEIDMFRF